MAQLPSSLSRATELQEFYANPLRFLAQAHDAFGDVFVLREEGPLFSRNSDCAGVVAVFGPAHTQAVLTDIDVFGLPISAAELLELPQRLVNLNRGLHSMRGKQHDQQQRLLLQIFNNRSIEAMQETITAGLNRFVRRWSYGEQISLLEEMRRLTLELSNTLLFDKSYGESDSLAALAQNYFHVRRNVTSAVHATNNTARTELIALGTSLDDAMRKYIRWSRNRGETSQGFLAKLACLQQGPEHSFSEDEAVAHGNVTFMSMTEPIAVALTWSLLILSQMPELRRTLLHDHAPLNSFVSESLRLFTPNALMSRITTRDTLLNGIPLPKRCELVLCPFIAHRDAKVFPRPTEFRPSRWQSTKPSPFEYFPFGAGGHTCIGRALGLKIITATLAFLTQRYELVLAFDQEIDWQIDIMFMPVNDPIMTLHEPGKDHSAGILRGPVTELFQL